MKPTEDRYYCASCGRRFHSLAGLYRGGGKDWLHDDDEEGLSACGPVLDIDGNRPEEPNERIDE